MIPIRLEELRRFERQLDLYSDELQRSNSKHEAVDQLAVALRSASRSVRAVINLWPPDFPAVIDRLNARPVESSKRPH